MFTSVLRIKNALLSLFLALVLLAIAVQPVYASNGNAYAYGKAKHSSTSTTPAESNYSSGNSAANTQTQSQASSVVPGDNGDIKTHNLTTPMNDHRDEPKVCGFYLDAFNFDSQQNVSWKIVKHTHGETVLSGSIVLASGNGRTTDLSLPNGMYKVYWNFNGEHGSAKHKVFKVDCETTPTTPPVVAHQKPIVNVKSNTCVVNGQMSGSLTISVTNPNAKSATYLVAVGTKSQAVTVAPGKTEVVQFTDLGHGTQTVKVYENGCDKVTVTVKVEECPPAPVGRGGGVVLSDTHSVTPGVLANTGNAPLTASLVASMLIAAATALFLKRPISKHAAIDAVSL